MMKKIAKGIAITLALALFLGGCWLANGFFGNPVSQWMAQRSAKRYIAAEFPDTGYELERVTFSFKDTSYHAYFTLPGSIDSDFSITVNMAGKVTHSYYEDNVLGGWNTAYRLGNDYRTAVDAVLQSETFGYTYYIGFGDLQFVPEAYREEPDVPSYALILEQLQRDGQYDISVLGKQAGELTLYIYDEEVTPERLAQIVLRCKEIFDDAGVTFRTIDCVLEHPRTDTGEQEPGRVEVMDFSYEDIYEEDLLTRVSASNEAAENNYAELDKQKAQELSDLQ